MSEQSRLLDRVERIKQTIEVLKFWEDMASDDALDADHWRKVREELDALSRYLVESKSNVEILRPRVEDIEKLLPKNQHQLI